MLRHHSKLALINTVLVTLGLSAAPVATLARAETAVTSPQTAPLLAQTNNCRRVTPNVNGLNVRQSPALTADVIGVVPGGRTVTLENTGQNGWVPIAAPFDGYVSASYLIYCNSAATEPGIDTPVANAPVAGASGVCREVIVRSGLNVRAEPTVYSRRVGALPTGTNVTAAGSEVNDWLPITEPMDGYVSTRFLGDC